MTGTVTAIDALSAAPIAGVTSAAAGNDVTVTLTTVTDNKRVKIVIDGVNGLAAPWSTHVGFLVGDVNNTRSVNSSDISGVKARSGQTANASNFMFDVNASGSISAADIATTKARSGLVMP